MGKLEEAQVVDQRWRAQVDERLEEHDNVLAQHAQQLAQGRERMANIESSTQRIEAGVKDLLEIFTAVRGFVKVGGWIGIAAKWASGILVVFGLLYWWWKTGEPPKGP